MNPKWQKTVLFNNINLKSDPVYPPHSHTLFASFILSYNPSKHVLRHFIKLAMENCKWIKQESHF